MPRKYVFGCDGCDRELTTDKDAIPSCWADVSIEITGYRNWRTAAEKEFSAIRLLCPNCQITMQSQSDPRYWTRAEQTKGEA